MKKFTKRCLWVISLLALLCACNTSTVSTMKTSQGPSSPSGFFISAKAIPDVQTAGLTSSILVSVLKADGSAASGETVSFNGNVSSTSGTTDTNGNTMVFLTVSEGTNPVTVTFEDIGTSVSVLGQP